MNNYSQFPQLTNKLNSRICLFCEKALCKQTAFRRIAEDSLYCPSDHIKVWFGGGYINHWTGFRIFTKPNIRAYHDDDRIQILSALDSMEIPFFDLSQYNLEQLQGKIETYLNFS